MALQFRYRKKARIDFYEAADWYEEQSPGKGQNFADNFIKTLQKILANPDTYRKVYQECRRIQFDGFPCYVIYKVGKKVIYIIAVYHNKRNDTWKKRLS
jgi:plasmid stabilization system protein ParE